MDTWYFETAVIFRNALLLSTLLCNTESWVGLTGKEVEVLEKVDEQLLRRILSAHSKTAIPALYLELGCVPIRFLVMQRRIGFLHYILNEDSESLIREVFDAQLAHPLKGDWCGQVKGDLEKLGLDVSLETLARWSEKELKSHLKSAVNCEAYKFLSDSKQDKSKIRDLKYSDLQLQPYLRAGRTTTIQEKCHIFKSRTRMLDLRANFKVGQVDLRCTKCDTGEEETQPHLLTCPGLSDTSVVTVVPEYEQLLDQDPDRVEKLGRILQQKFNMFKSDSLLVPGDRSFAAAVSATEGN